MIVSSGANFPDSGGSFLAPGVGEMNTPDGLHVTPGAPGTGLGGVGAGGGGGGLGLGVGVGAGGGVSGGGLGLIALELVPVVALGLAPVVALAPRWRRWRWW